MAKLTFDDPMFQELRDKMDDALQQLLTQMNGEGNKEGKLGMALGVELIGAESYDEETGERRAVETPMFSFKVTFSTKHQRSAGGTAGSTDYFLDYNGTDWTKQPTRTNQHSMFD